VRFENFDVRAVLSIWTKWYLNAFLPPVLLADLLLMRGLSAPLDRVEFIVGEDGRVSAIKMDGAGQDTSDQGDSKLGADPGDGEIFVVLAAFDSDLR
jgi:ferric iron reductase protein FhuF